MVRDLLELNRIEFNTFFAFFLWINIESYLWQTKNEIAPYKESTNLYFY